MGICEVCGNSYKDILEIKSNKTNEVHLYDCFECAIQGLAPKCSHCGVKILGHGVEIAEEFFCCAHCARQKGFTHIVDHADLELVQPH